MALAETAQLIVTLDAKGNFQTEMRKGATALKGFAGEAGKTDKQMTGLRAKLRSPELRAGLLQGVGLSGGLIGFQVLGSAVNGAIDYMGGALDAASDLTESLSKVDAVFEDSAPTVRRWASTLDASFGITERGALESAGTLGNFLTALGQTEKDAASLSTSIVELAGDLSSFNNIASSDVLVALQAGLAGETEPVRRLGIDISAARVEALLLAEGVEKVNGEFTQAQKVQGRYLAIMRDTAKAQGDAARTAETRAGRQRQLNANLGDLSATIGQLIEDPATDITGWLVDGSEAALAFAAAIPDLQKNLQGLQGDLEDTVGRDIVNDIANLSRIGATGGLILIPDAIGQVTDNTTELGGAVEDLVGEGTALGGFYNDWFGANTLIGGSLSDLADDITGVSREAGSTMPRAFAGARNGLANYVEAADEAGASTKALERSGVGLGMAFDNLVTVAGEDLASAIAKFRKETYDARNALRSFRDAADQIAETRNIQKVNAALAKQRRLRGEAAREGNVRAFAAAQARLEELKAERRLIRQGRRALKAFQERKKQEAQSERTTARQANNAQRSRRKSINDTIAKLEELGNTKANPRVTIAGIAAAQAQLTTLRETLAALRSEAGVTYDPVTGQVRSSVPGRASGGPVSAGRAYIVGEHRPEVFVPSENGRIVPNVQSGGGGGVEVYVTPYLTVAASQVEGHTSKVIRTQRFREKN